MSKSHPQNGPTFSKAPPKKHPPKTIVSPARRQAELDQQKRDAADRRLLSKEPRSWLKKHGLATGELPADPPLKRRKF